MYEKFVRKTKYYSCKMPVRQIFLIITICILNNKWFSTEFGYIYLPIFFNWSPVHNIKGIACPTKVFSKNLKNKYKTINIKNYVC